MSFYDDHQIQQLHPHVQLQQDKNLIQLPKIIIQPGPSPFSGRKQRVTTPISNTTNTLHMANIIDTDNNNTCNKQVNSQQQQQQHSIIYLDKTSPEQLSDINQSHIQLYQMNETDTNNTDSITSDHLNSPLPMYTNSQTPIQSDAHHDSLLDQSDLMNQFHNSTTSVPLNNNNHGTLSDNSNTNSPRNSSASGTNVRSTGFSSSSSSSGSKRKSSTLANKANINGNGSHQVIPSSSIVPTLTNVDEIFHLLSQKIAKYCQILADLTNCEVFYKAQLPINTINPVEAKHPKRSKSNHHTDKSSNHSYQKKYPRKRSLYWGTHQMLFQYSHDQGLKYDKSGGDSLIKINQRSISNDVTNLIEEILNAPNIQEELIETNQSLAKFITKSKSLDSASDLDQRQPVKSTVQLIDPDHMEAISLSASTPVLQESPRSMNNLTNEFNLINELNQSAEPEFNLSELNSTDLKMTDRRVQSGAQSSNDKIDFKDCCVYLKRMDDMVIESYLDKFEMKYNRNESSHANLASEIVSESNASGDESSDDQRQLSLNEMPEDNELYSDEFRFVVSERRRPQTVKGGCDTMGSSVGSCEENSKDVDSPVSLCGDGEINENDEDYYTCDLCPAKDRYSYRHLTQLKIHQLRVHKNVNLSLYECAKCGLDNDTFQSNRAEYLKHTLNCYYPHLYTCKTCHRLFATYAQYMFHTRYIHTNVFYMCAICLRKYRHIKDLLEHDQLMHSKAMNYCEICYEPHKSRTNLYEHYRTVHLVNGYDEQEVMTRVAGKEAEIRRSRQRQETGGIVSNINFIGHTMNQDNLNLNKSLDINGASSVLNDQNSLNPFVLSMQELDKASTTQVKQNPELQEHQEQVDNHSKCSSNSSVDMFEWSKRVNKNDWGKVQKNDLIRGLLDRKHQCKWCSLRFYTKTQLKQHETTHMNSVLYCPVCDKQFMHKDRLSGHMKCHMEPSLECKVCGKKFKRLCNLYNHELVHGLTEHAFMLCQFCGRGFRSRRDYQNHVIANHRDQLMKADNSEVNSNQQQQQQQEEQQNSAPGEKKMPENRRINLTIGPSVVGRKIKPPNQNPMKTTTIILSSDENLNSPMLVDIEPETYFTRTGVHHHFQSPEDESQSDTSLLVQIDDQHLS